MQKEYFFYIALGVPFYMFGQALNPNYPRGRQPEICDGIDAGGRDIEHDLRPGVHFRVPLGYDGRGGCDGAGADCDGGACNLVFVQYACDSPGKGRF